MGLLAMSPEHIENRGTILLIDDRPRTLVARADILMRRGFEVELASTIEQAESRWQPGRYILVLFAVRKGLLRAAECCERMKHQRPRQMIGMLVAPEAELPPMHCPDLLWPEENLDYFLARVDTLAAFARVA
jgi:response regulator RpfG family c-di-GMP phosphodiesterase